MAKSFVASGDISANQFEAVRMSAAASFEVSAVTANTQVPIGILQNDPNAAGLAAEVAVVGEIAKARYGGTVDEGDRLGIDADGELIARTPAAAGGTDYYQIAIALEAGADQEVHYVLVVGPVWIETA